MTNFYLQTFTNPKGLNLIITGCFDVDSVVRLAANTFGRMQVNDKFKYSQNEHPGQFTHPADSLIHFSSDNDKQTNCNFIFTDNYTPGLRQTLMFKLMRDILQARMLSELRQKSGIVYSPFADVNYNGVPRRIVWFRLYIDVQNENVMRMEKQMQDIIDDLGRNPVTDTELDKMKRSFIVTKRKSLADDSSGEWLDVILDRITNGETFSDYNQYDDVLNSITPEDNAVANEAFGMMAQMGANKDANPTFLGQAQGLKDATMAWFIAQNLDKAVIHFNGNYHTAAGNGIIKYLHTYAPKAKEKTIYSVKQETTDTLDDAYAGQADFYLCVPEDMVTSY